MAKKWKLARCSGALEDRLSSLPNEILINNILPLLPTKEAQRTSILARSWRYLWLYVPCLDLDGFPTLDYSKSLTLKAVSITSGSLERLLLACGESLEKLQLARVSVLTRVNVTGLASRLKHIHIDCCNQLDSITIHAPTPDLVSFAYPVNSKEITLHIEHAPRLVDLRMVLPYRAFQRITLHPLFRYLSQLEALHLVQFPCDMEIDPLHDFPVLSCLKHLKLDFTGSAGPDGFIGQKLRCLASLIEIAPSLQHLTLEVHGDGMSLKLLKELANMRLQFPVPVIEIAGFRGRKVDCKLALHLINAAPSLEKLILDRRDPSRRGCMLGPYAYPEKTIKSWEKVVKEVIEPEVPSKAKLVLI